MDILRSFQFIQIKKIMKKKLTIKPNSHEVWLDGYRQYYPASRKENLLDLVIPQISYAIKT